jgi:predicted RNA binding protein YcfA (HicA-like mRNA interferase family)
MTANELIRLLEENGWRFVRQNGSHRIFKHPDSERPISVPFHGKKDIKKGLLQAILKQAGLK